MREAIVGGAHDADTNTGYDIASLCLLCVNSTFMYTPGPVA